MDKQSREQLAKAISRERGEWRDLDCDEGKMFAALAALTDLSHRIAGEIRNSKARAEFLDACLTEQERQEQRDRIIAALGMVTG